MSNHVTYELSLNDVRLSYNHCAALKPFKLNVGSCLACCEAVRQTLFHGRSWPAGQQPLPASLSTQVNSD